MIFFCFFTWLIMSSAVLAQGGVRDTVLTVRSGDTLFGIAARLLPYSTQYTTGDLVGEIKEQNGLQIDVIRPGQRLVVLLETLDLLDQPVPRDADFAACGIYVRAPLAGSNRIFDLVDELVAAGGNTVVFDVKDRHGNLGYDSSVPLALAIGAGAEAPITQPAKLIDLLHRRDIHVVARLTCFYDARLARERPDMVPLARQGQHLWSERGTPQWVDPSLPEVQEYLLALVREVAELGVDEIQLDYLRFPTEGDLSDAVFAFDPDILPKHRVITRFVAEVRRELDTTETLLSADIFGVAAWGQEADLLSVGQHLPDLLPYLDIVSPMLYPSHFADGFAGIERPVDHPYYFQLKGCMRLQKLAVDHQVLVRPWIQAFDYRVPDFDTQYIIEQLYGAEDGGAQGWLLWHPSSDYGVGMEAIARFKSGSTEAVPEQERFPIKSAMDLSPVDGVAD